MNPIPTLSPAELTDLARNQTALQIAVRRNNERMVNALLRVDGIQPNIPDLKLHTPLHYAVRVGNEYMINNLIHHGADANVEVCSV
jgi:ankyrin repeat protein